MRFANYTCAKFPCCGDFTAWYQTEGDKETVSMLSSLSSFSKGPEADIRSMPSVGCLSTCTHIYLYICIYIYISAYLWHVHTTTVVAKKEQQLPKCQSSIYCELFMSQVQGAVGLRLWLFSTAKNSSRSFTWERVAFFRNHWFWVVFLSLWPFKKLHFWCLIFCATFMIMAKNVPILPSEVM